jgi:voltage-gated potassium channel
VSGLGRRAGTALLVIANRPRLLMWSIIGDYLGCSTAYALIEDRSLLESLWWAVVTATTVGYGDQYPASAPGRFVGAFLILSMLVLTWIGTAQITARLIQDPHISTHAEQEEIKAQLNRIEAMLAERPNRAS